MPKLEISTIDDFELECKSRKVEEVAVTGIYQARGDKQVGSVTSFVVLVTARDNELILSYKEYMGHAVSYFQDEMKVLNEKTYKR